MQECVHEESEVPWEGNYLLFHFFCSVFLSFQGSVTSASEKQLIMCTHLLWQCAFLPLTALDFYIAFLDLQASRHLKYESFFHKVVVGTVQPYKAILGVLLNSHSIYRDILNPSSLAGFSRQFASSVGVFWSTNFKNHQDPCWFLGWIVFRFTFGPILGRVEPGGVEVGV